MQAKIIAIPFGTKFSDQRWWQFIPQSESWQGLPYQNYTVTNGRYVLNYHLQIYNVLPGTTVQWYDNDSNVYLGNNLFLYAVNHYQRPQQNGVKTYRAVITKPDQSTETLLITITISGTIDNNKPYERTGVSQFVQNGSNNITTALDINALKPQISYQNDNTNGVWETSNGCLENELYKIDLRDYCEKH